MTRIDTRFKRQKPKRKPLDENRPVTVTLERNEWLDVLRLLKLRDDPFSRKVCGVLSALVDGKKVEGSRHLNDGRIALSRQLDSWLSVCHRMIPRTDRVPTGPGASALHRQVQASHILGQLGGDI